MLGSAGRSEFFAREASDYLRALEPLLGDHPPEGEAFVRLARALRGAAMLAGPASYTRAASLLEQIARRAREPGFDWTAAVPRLREAHGTFTRLTSHATAWSAPRDTEADALSELLGQIGTSPPAPAPTPVPPATEPRGADQSSRQFIGREAAAVAGALRDAAHGLASVELPSLERLSRVSDAMHSLRGLAGLVELAPLGDLLDAADTAVRELLRYPALPAGASQLCLNGAEAFSRIAHDVASRGRTDPELPEAHRFADQLRQALTGPDSVVSVDDLDGGAPVLSRPELRFAGPLDLSTLGERMRAGADQLRSAPSRAAGRLQCLVLLALLRDAPGGLGRRPAGRLIASIIDRLDAVVDQGDPTTLASLLEEAGTCLVDGAGGDLVELEERLDRVGQDADVVPIEVLLEEEPVIDIGALAPDVERPALDLPADRTVLERSLSHYSRLVREGAPAPVLHPLPEPEPVDIADLAPEPVQAMEAADLEVVSIDDLAPEPVETVRAWDIETGDEPVAIEDLAPDDDFLTVSIDDLAPEPVLVPVPGLAPGSDDASVIPIEELLYTGSGALARADEVRHLLEVSLQMATTELDRVEPLVRELLDLVPLALVSAD